MQIVQGIVLAPLTVLGTWLLARRLFGIRTGIAAAFAVAIFPACWEFIGLLYPEALAVPLALLALNLFLEREPTTKLAIATGLAIGLGMLVRPNMFFLFAGVIAAWWIAAGPRRALVATGISILAAVLLIVPWTIRNLSAADGFVPISIQDAAAYGTFNRPPPTTPTTPTSGAPTSSRCRRSSASSGSSDYEVHRALVGDAVDYAKAHPDSIPKAFFWNGLSRFWDVRRPAHAIDEIAPNGQSKGVAITGLVLYWVALVLALWGLWLFRRRLGLVVPVLLIALAASITVIGDASTRYRAPLEPLIVILACAAPLAARRNRDSDPVACSQVGRESDRGTTRGERAWGLLMECEWVRAAGVGLALIGLAALAALLMAFAPAAGEREEDPQGTQRPRLLPAPGQAAQGPRQDDLVPQVDGSGAARGRRPQRKRPLHLELAAAASGSPSPARSASRRASRRRAAGR